jgi:hypothetical protein
MGERLPRPSVRQPGSSSLRVRIRGGIPRRPVHDATRAVRSQQRSGTRAYFQEDRSRDGTGNRWMCSVGLGGFPSGIGQSSRSSLWHGVWDERFRGPRRLGDRGGSRWLDRSRGPRGIHDPFQPCGRLTAYVDARSGGWKLDEDSELHVPIKVPNAPVALIWHVNPAQRIVLLSHIGPS